ncbi:MAG: DUF3105 domain-containing protein [Rubrobacter sp.]|nr:DUF3105 domain-containing protein [Rubrobacter sp.]
MVEPEEQEETPARRPCAELAEVRLLQRPIQNDGAVHCMDHGTAWAAYRPELPTEQVNILRGLAREEYVLVSPYPGLYAPVVPSAWRISARSRRGQRAPPATVRASVPTQRYGTAFWERMRERCRGARVVGAGCRNRSVVIDPRFRG